MPRWASWDREGVDRGWMVAAACGPDVADLFFPTPGQGGGHPDYGPALSICRRCPVIDACFSYAVASGEIVRTTKHGWHTRYGVWSGITPPLRSARLGRPSRAVVEEAT